MNELDRHTEYVAQYIPAGGHAFTDLTARASAPEADAAISDNILSWQVHEHQSGTSVVRPRRYRVIRRTVIEELLSEREDDGAPLRQS